MKVDAHDNGEFWSNSLSICYCYRHIGLHVVLSNQVLGSIDGVRYV